LKAPYRLQYIYSYHIVNVHQHVCDHYSNAIIIGVIHQSFLLGINLIYGDTRWFRLWHVIRV